MSRKFAILLVPILLSFVAQGQWSFPAMTGRGGGLAGCGTALTDCSGVNVAGCAWQEVASIGLSARNTALLKELSYGELFACVPVRKHGAFSFAIDHFGSSAYHEQRASLGYALPMGWLAIGARIDCLHSGTSDPYYEPLNQLSFAAGIMAKATDKLTLGLRTEGARLWSLGAAYRLAEELTGTLEVEYQGQCRLRTGLEYCWQKVLYARAGVASNPSIYAFGLGYRGRHLTLDLAMQQQLNLGATMQTTIIYHL